MGRIVKTDKIVEHDLFKTKIKQKSKDARQKYPNKETNTHTSRKQNRNFFLSRSQILQQPGIKMAYKGFNIDVRNYMEDCSSNPRDIILLFKDAYLVQMTQFLTLLGV